MSPLRMSIYYYSCPHFGGTASSSTSPPKLKLTEPSFTLKCRWCYININRKLLKAISFILCNNCADLHARGYHIHGQENVSDVIFLKSGDMRFLNGKTFCMLGGEFDVTNKKGRSVRFHDQYGIFLTI